MPSLRIQDRRTVKSKTEKVKDLLTNTPTKEITEFIDLLYTVAKLNSEKLGPLEDHRQKVKSRVGNQTGIIDQNTTTIKNAKTKH